MPDNGYGAKTNSGDFLLRLYRIRPDFKTAAGGTERWQCSGSCSCATPTGRSRSRCSGRIGC